MFYIGNTPFNTALYLGIQCICKPGFGGSYCETRLDPCQSFPCMNLGICEISGSSYTCTCQPGYAGPDCQVGQPVPVPVPVPITVPVPVPEPVPVPVPVPVSLPEAPNVSRSTILPLLLDTALQTISLSVFLLLLIGPAYSKIKLRWDTYNYGHRKTTVRLKV